MNPTIRLAILPAAVFAAISTTPALAQEGGATIPVRVEEAAGAVDSVGVDLLLFNGEMSLESGDYAEAAQTFRQALAMDPDRTESRLLLARALTMSVLDGRLAEPDAKIAGKEALDEFLTVLGAEPENIEAIEALRLLSRRFAPGGQPNLVTDRGRLSWEAGLTAMTEMRYDDAAARFEEVTRAEPHQSMAYGARGDALRELGRFADAAESYHRGVEENPFDPWSRAGYGYCLEQEGKPDQAFPELRLAFELAESPAWASGALTRILEARRDRGLTEYERSLLARAYGDADRWDDVRSLLEGAVTDSSSLGVRRTYALSFYFLDDIDTALEKLLAIHRDYPQDLETVYYVGAAYLRNGDGELGRRYLSAVVAVDPDNANALKLLGLSLSDEPGHETESIAILSRAARLGANIEHLPCLLGLLHMRIGETDDAWKAFEACLDDTPDFGPALLGLGSIAAERGDNGQAIIYLQRYLADGRGDPGATMRLGVAYLRAGRDEEGFDVLRRLTVEGGPFAAPDDKPVTETGLLEMASFFLATVRDFDGAIWVGERLLTIDPESSGYNNNLAMAYADADRDPERAHDLAVKATTSAPDDPGHLDTLGWTLVRLGRNEEAEATLKRALELSEPLGPESQSEIRYHLGVLYRLTDRDDEADAMLEEALQHPPTPQLRREMEKLLAPPASQPTDESR